MTPSILAPLNTAPAQLSGPDALGSDAMSNAQESDSASFRDLVAQESGDGNAAGRESQGDERGDEAPATAARPESATESAADDADGDDRDGAESASTQATPGGQALPLAAATDGLSVPTSLPADGTGELANGTGLGPAGTGGAPSPATLTQTPAEAAQARGTPLSAGSLTSAANTALAATAAANTPAATAANAPSRSGTEGRGEPISAIGRNGGSGRRGAGSDGNGGDRLAANGPIAAREGVIVDGLRTFGSGLGNGLGTLNSLGAGERPLNVSALASQSAAAAAPPAPGNTGALPGVLAPNALFTLDATGTASSNPTSFELSQPVGSQAWQQELGGRMQWLADARIGRAELRLNPPELGPLEITLNVRGEEVSATFQAQHAATREAVEQALPRLREMMAQSGLQLADTNVGQQGAEQQSANSQEGRGGENPSSRFGQPSASADVELQTADLRLDSRFDGNGVGQLDLYA